MIQPIAVIPPRRQGLPRSLRWLMIAVAVLVTLTVTGLGYSEYRNSREVPPPTAAELRDHLDRATGWVFAHSAQVSAQDNAMLWLFLWQAAKLDHNSRLLDMVNNYREHDGKDNLLRFAFDSTGVEQVTRKRLVFGDRICTQPHRGFIYWPCCWMTAAEYVKKYGPASPKAAPALPQAALHINSPGTTLGWRWRQSGAKNAQPGAPSR